MTKVTSLQQSVQRLINAWYTMPPAVIDHYIQECSVELAKSQKKDSQSKVCSIDLTASGPVHADCDT